MKITLVPQRRDDNLIVSKAGETLTINGTAFDFSVIPEGATLPASAVDCEYITGSVERINGVLQISLVLPHGPNPSQEVAFPAPIVNPPDGVLELPQ
jgi:hypothetical protein